MLLPSALSCDSSQPPSQQQQQQQQPPSRLPVGLFASPPASPPTYSSTSQNAFGNFMTTCRSLQSLMSTPPSSSSPDAFSPSLAQLPTPPMAYAPPPTKLRLRSRHYNTNSPAEEHQQTSRAPRRIVKRAAPRGANKRRGSIDDDLGRESDAEYSSSDDHDTYTTTTHAPTTPAPTTPTAIQEPTPVNSDEVLPPAPSTPKRSRIAPEQLPLGLERSDFHDLHRQEGGEAATASDEWTPEDDRMLVELVLEKLKLSKTEWQDCARNLGKDRHSLSRRWKSLMTSGDVGLKRNHPRRGKLHSTWR